MPMNENTDQHEQWHWRQYQIPYDYNQASLQQSAGKNADLFK